MSNGNRYRAIRSLTAPRRRMVAMAVGAAFAATSSQILANPSGGTVAAGSATFAVNGNTLTVTNTPGAIINWQQFSIQKDEITRFIQQSASSAVLNRVISQNPSLILGMLQSNGRVFLINPSGIAFGQGAVIDVAGFAASSLNMSDADFTSGRMRFLGTGLEGKVTNAGTIRTPEGGHVYLVAPNVENEASGVITSPKGEVVIAAGKSVELVNARTPDLRVEFTAPENEAVNAGQIIAASGSVGIYGTLIKNARLVSASRAEVGEGGRIVLKAVKDITLDATSRIEANGTKGGSIAVQSDSGTLIAQGTIEAKGQDLDGGTIALLANRVVSAASADTSSISGQGGAISIEAGTAGLGSDNVIQGSYKAAQTIVRGGAGNDSFRVDSDSDLTLDGRGGSDSFYVTLGTRSGQSVLIRDTGTDAGWDVGVFGTRLGNGTALDEVRYSAAGADLTGKSGVFTYLQGTKSQSIAFSGLEPTEDLTVAATLNVNLTVLAGQVVNINSSGALSTALDPITSLNELTYQVAPASQELVTFRNKTNVVVNGGGTTGSDTFNVNLTALGSGGAPSTLTINAASGGSTTNLTASVAAVTVNGGAGTDTLQGALVSNATLTGSVAGSGFAGSFGGHSFTSIDVLNGSGSLTGRDATSTWTLGATQSYSDGTASLAFSGFTTLQGGTAADAFNVTGATSAALKGGAGADTFTIGAALTGSVAGEAGGDTITVNTGGSVSSTVAGGADGDTLNGTAITDVVLTASTADGHSGTTGAITGGFSGINTLTGSGAGTLTGQNVASTWNVGASSTYNDNAGNGALAFSGFSTLQGGSQADIFNLNAATTALTFRGGAGADTFNISAFTAATLDVDAEAGTDIVNVNGVINTTGATTLSAETINLSAGITTSNANISLTGATVLQNPVTLNSGAGAGNITFTGGISGNQGLTLIAGTGNVSVTGAVSNVASLQINSSTTSQFDSNVNINGGVTLQAGAGNVSFLSGLTTGAASNFVNTGTLQIGDATGADSSSISSGFTHTAGHTTLGGDGTGALTSLGAVLLGTVSIPLGAVAKISAGANTVTFNSTVEGPGALVVNASGDTRFKGTVGLATSLASIQTDNNGADKTIIEGGLVKTVGSQTFNDAVELGAVSNTTNFRSTGAANLFFGRTFTGNAGDVNVGQLGELVGDFTVSQALTNVDDLTVFAASATITNSGNAVTNTVSFQTTGNVNHFESGAVLIEASNVGGALNLSSANGGITTSTTGQVRANSMAFSASDGGAGGNITIGAGGLCATGTFGSCGGSGSSIRLHAADNVTVNGAITSNGGAVTIVAGTSTGLNTSALISSAGFPSVGNAGAPATEVADNLGAVTLNASINAGAGNVTIITAGDATATASQSDVTQGINGRIVGNNLTVVTLKGAGGIGNGGAAIDLNDANPKNLTGSISLFSCPSNGCPSPVPTSLVNSSGGTQYASGQIDYSDSAGVNVSGIGTVSDFSTFSAGSMQVTGGAGISAGNLIFESGADIDVNLASNLTQINAAGTGSLRFIAGGDLRFNNRAGGVAKGSIGTSSALFNHDLVFQAGGNLTLENSIFMGAKTLTLSADASFATGNQTVTSNGAGNVLMQGNQIISTNGPINISGIGVSILGAPGVFDFTSVGGVGTAGTAAFNQSLNGQELTSTGTINFLNSGAIAIEAGTATGTSAAGARVTGATVNVGTNGGASNPTQLLVRGGTNSIGYVTSNSADPLIEFRQADALVKATGDMNVYLRSAAAPTGIDAEPFGGAYSLIVQGGTATANDNGGAVRYVTALGAMRAKNMILSTGGSILIEGGTSNLNSTSALAATSGIVLVETSKSVTAGGALILKGGQANVSSSLSSVSARNALAAAQLDPSKLTITAKDIVLQGGETTGPTGSLVSARIDAGDEILINVTGPSTSYTYSNTTSGTKTLNGSFFMIGSDASGFFDANNIPLGAGGAPGAYPITVNFTGGGGYAMDRDTGRGGGIVQTGLSTFDMSLLSYIIFAANEETRSNRIRQGLSGDDAGAPTCK